MLNKLDEVITDCSHLGQRCIMRDGYVFTAVTEPGNIYDAIVVRNPWNIPCFFPRFLDSSHSLEEHIALINDLNLEKAVIIGNNIDFLPLCPSLKYLRVLPAETAAENFDFSPLYQMPQIIQLFCQTVYGKKDEHTGSVDYSKIHGLQRLSISGTGHHNYSKVRSLKQLGISGFKGKNRDLTDLYCSEELEELRMIQCSNKSLAGIEQSRCLQMVDLSYNRVLSDISQLVLIKDTLKKLYIESCPKITDFSCLAELEQLEHLELIGNNTLPDLSFLRHMKRLKIFCFSMDVFDGDLSPCLHVPYVWSHKNRKHFNLKDCDLPKKR